MDIRKNPVNADGIKVPPIVWDCSCLEEVCGTCTMRINGEVRQSCSALVDKLKWPIVNKEYLKGQSSSLQIGISALPEDCDAAVIILGDMPDIKSTLINQLIENYNPSDNKSIIIPTYKNKKGNPILIDREFFPDILSIKGDKGAKDIIKFNKKYINEIPQKYSAIINDIDTKEDLAKYIKGSHDN